MVNNIFTVIVEKEKKKHSIYERFVHCNFNSKTVSMQKLPNTNRKKKKEKKYMISKWNVLSTEKRIWIEDQTFRQRVYEQVRKSSLKRQFDIRFISILLMVTSTLFYCYFCCTKMLWNGKPIFWQWTILIVLNVWHEKQKTQWKLIFIRHFQAGTWFECFLQSNWPSWIYLQLSLLNFWLFSLEVLTGRRTNEVKKRLKWLSYGSVHIKLKNSLEDSKGFFLNVYELEFKKFFFVTPFVLI